MARHTAAVTCQVVVHGGEAIRYITGTGTGKTKPAAGAAAEKDADRPVPQGHYKRHWTPLSWHPGMRRQRAAPAGSAAIRT
ncbi:hypothetical protein LTT66_02240 [Nocardia gipuzkoensis]|uniref:hypothetical protein n=1 Tax=Nocardia gipuzkoensis TaxID=2749991 RepID=UPI001E5D042E|nr:hypothetical protein [Nocardia gipuzkoensis]UGT69065.1 hypothetical protein LTT66_02240 [Nocardia gipuzkoensis]